MIFISLSNPVFASKQALSFWLTQVIRAYRKSMQTANYPRKGSGNDHWQSKRNRQTRPSLLSGYSTRMSWVGLNVSKLFRINIATGVSALGWGLIWLPVFTTLSRWAELLKELYFLYDEIVSSISGHMNSQSSTDTLLGALKFLLLQCGLTALEGLSWNNWLFSVLLSFLPFFHHTLNLSRLFNRNLI